MNKQHRGNRYKKPKPALGDKAKEVLQNLDENNATIQMFKEYARQLDEHHDRYERVVKLGRDITIESKRIIFLLHNSNIDLESKRTSILQEANIRLESLFLNNFKAIATELKDCDQYLYHRAYTNGLQEFIEALCFYQFLKQEEISTWVDIKENFSYTDESNNSESVVKFNLLFPQYDFILGIADFTGELMRRCINTLGAGNTEDCFKLTNFVRMINSGFIGLHSPGCREISKKHFVLRQSLSKMELVCYNIRIRGSEIPKEMLLTVIESREIGDKDEDEGFY